MAVASLFNIQHVAHHLMSHGESKAIEMAVGIVKNWAHGHDGHGHKVHPDVRAAAAANIAKWEELKARAKGSHLAKDAKPGHSGKTEASYGPECGHSSDILELALYSASFLPQGSTPGAKTLYGNQLYHQPNQAVSASPPLPPKVSPPAPGELRQLAGEVQLAGGSDPEHDPERGLLLGASKHINTAANMMATQDHAGALRMLRVAAAGIRAAHLQAKGEDMPVANVFSAQLAPAERSSAMAAMAEANDTHRKYRLLHVAVASNIDRIRRSLFRGMYGNTGVPTARFSQEPVMSALGKVLALADSSGDSDDSTATLVAALDATLDEACRLLMNADMGTCAPEVRQARDLVYAAGVVVDGLMDKLSIEDPDDDGDSPVSY